jgi:microsomal dipeptidase-like Zn-dependent dipeptidase
MVGSVHIGIRADFNLIKAIINRLKSIARYSTLIKTIIKRGTTDMQAGSY